MVGNLVVHGGLYSEELLEIIVGDFDPGGAAPQHPAPNEVLCQGWGMCALLSSAEDWTLHAANNPHARAGVTCSIGRYCWGRIVTLERNWWGVRGSAGAGKSQILEICGRTGFEPVRHHPGPFVGVSQSQFFRDLVNF